MRKDVGEMIPLLTLAVAVGTAQPCLAPPKAAKHHHSHIIGNVPIQSCVTPPVPMCFREPAPVPDIEPLAAPLIYYTVGLLPDDSPPPPADDTSQDEPPIIAGGGVVVIGTYGPIGGGGTPEPPGGYSPPPVGTPCCATPPTRAPEMNGPGAAGALTLLLGFVAVLRGRRRA